MAREITMAADVSMVEPLPNKIWRLSDELNGAIDEAVRKGYRVDVTLSQARLLGYGETITSINTSIYSAVTKENTKAWPPR
jgi:hypothetical protein